MANVLLPVLECAVRRPCSHEHKTPATAPASHPTDTAPKMISSDNAAAKNILIAAGQLRLDRPHVSKLSKPLG